ncbi:hypothetical protein D9757_009227 [Collybiopsis confluens]|uniref:Metallo-beta-lactamase domain-containing protein n=1 Tax=Collybiopsis confluens TaxID=2823264 RepID=A0A8H5H9W0_9AGAR|nr:hypothetical protein D9757_009227 [Collybiopsis confluens]
MFHSNNINSKLHQDLFGYKATSNQCRYESATRICRSRHETFRVQSNLSTPSLYTTNSPHFLLLIYLHGLDTLQLVQHLLDACFAPPATPCAPCPSCLAPSGLSLALSPPASPVPSDLPSTPSPILFAPPSTPPVPHPASPVLLSPPASIPPVPRPSSLALPLELDLDKDGLTIGGTAAHDFFGDGSFYLLDMPGHWPGHLVGLTRTTSTKHFACPGELLLTHLPKQIDLSKPILDIPEHSTYADRTSARVSQEKLAEIEAHPDVFLVASHDGSLESILELFPKSVDDWKEQGLKQKAVWAFLEEGNRAAGYN